MISTPIIPLALRHLRARYYFALPLLFGGFTPTAFAACDYSINSSWQDGFVASIRITNDTPASVHNWSVNWRYTGNNRVSSVWNAELDGAHPYTATPLGWNAVIAPGQSLEFGI